MHGDQSDIRWQLWIGFTPMSFSMGVVTTLTIVGLVADVGREHIAVATSRESGRSRAVVAHSQCHTSRGRWVRSSVSPSRALCSRSSFSGSSPRGSPAREQKRYVRHERRALTTAYRVHSRVLGVDPRPAARVESGCHHVVREGPARRVCRRHRAQHSVHARWPGHAQRQPPKPRPEEGRRGG